MPIAVAGQAIHLASALLSGLGHASIALVPLMNAIGFGGLNAFAATLVLPVIIFSVVLARTQRRAEPGAARA
ncbi:MULTISPECIES: hypothetical protein [Streptomyces]|nr:hypothetical protein [Streptomyces melanosporofaciens]